MGPPLWNLSINQLLLSTPPLGCVSAAGAGEAVVGGDAVSVAGTLSPGAGEAPAAPAGDVPGASAGDMPTAGGGIDAAGFGGAAVAGAFGGAGGAGLV